jgi:stage V sporulation protein B
MGFGLFALSEPIFRLFYSGYDGTLGGELLAVLGIASIFVCLMLVANSVLQAYGKVHIPIVTMLIGGILKITLNYNLVAIPAVNIHGAPIGTLACFAFVALANLYFVARFSKTRLRYASFFAKPLVASALMVLTARGVFALAARFVSFGSARLTLLVCVAVAVGAAVVVYFALVLALRIITRDDLQLLPKGEMLGKLLKIR